MLFTAIDLHKLIMIMRGGLLPDMHAGIDGVQKTGHFGRRFALHAHGDAKGAQFQIGALAVEQLAHQVGGLLAREVARAGAAAADFFEIRADSHEVYFGWAWVAAQLIRVKKE